MQCSLTPLQVTSAARGGAFPRGDPRDPAEGCLVQGAGGLQALLEPDPRAPRWKGKREIFVECTFKNACCTTLVFDTFLPLELEVLHSLGTKIIGSTGPVPSPLCNCLRTAVLA